MHWERQTCSCPKKCTSHRLIARTPSATIAPSDTVSTRRYRTQSLCYQVQSPFFPSRSSAFFEHCLVVWMVLQRQKLTLGEYHIINQIKINRQITIDCPYTLKGIVSPAPKVSPKHRSSTQVSLATYLAGSSVQRQPLDWPPH